MIKKNNTILTRVLSRAGLEDAQETAAAASDTEELDGAVAVNSKDRAAASPKALSVTAAFSALSLVLEAREANENFFLGHSSARSLAARSESWCKQKTRSDYTISLNIRTN